MQLDLFPEDVYSHLVNAQTGREAVTIVKETIKKASNVNFSWKCKRSGGVRLLVWCLKLLVKNFKPL